MPVANASSGIVVQFREYVGLGVRRLVVEEEWRVGRLSQDHRARVMKRNGRGMRQRPSAGKERWFKREGKERKSVERDRAKNDKLCE